MGKDCKNTGLGSKRVGEKTQRHRAKGTIKDRKRSIVKKLRQSRKIDTKNQNKDAIE